MRFENKNKTNFPFFTVYKTTGFFSYMDFNILYTNNSIESECLTQQRNWGLEIFVWHRFVKRRSVLHTTICHCTIWKIRYSLNFLWYRIEIQCHLIRASGLYLLVFMEYVHLLMVFYVFLQSAVSGTWLGGWLCVVVWNELFVKASQYEQVYIISDIRTI